MKALPPVPAPAGLLPAAPVVIVPDEIHAPGTLVRIPLAAVEWYEAQMRAYEGAVIRGPDTYTIEGKTR